MNFLKSFLLIILFPIFVFSQVNVINPDVIEGIAYQKNFIKNSSFEKNASGVNTYNDSADSGRDANNFKDGTGGAGSVACTRSTTSPIADKASLVFSKGASNLSGHGCSIDFTVPLDAKTRVLKIEFSYLVSSGTFVAGSQSTNSDVLVYLYDVTNSKIVDAISNNKLFSNSSSIVDTFSATFQADATASNYRLVFHTATTGTTAFGLKIDNILVSKINYSFGQSSSNWIPYSPTYSGLGTVSTTKAFYRQNGPNIEIYIRGTTGTHTGVEATISLPPGLSIDTTTVGSAKISGGTYKSSIAGNDCIVEAGSNPTTMALTTIGAAENRLLGTALNNTQNFDLIASFPILGWSSANQQSDVYTNRKITSKYSFVGATAIPTSSTVELSNTYATYTKSFDYTNSFDTTTGRFTAPIAGTYKISAIISFASNSWAAGNNIQVQVFKNGSALGAGGGIGQKDVEATATLNQSITGYTKIELLAGETISIAVYQTNAAARALSATATFNSIAIELDTNPQTISATDIVVASYGVGSGQTLTSAAIIKGDTKVVDTHGAYNTTTGVYTVPAAGLYRISHTFFSITATSAWNVQIRKNTSTLLTSTDTIPQYNGGTSIVNNRSMNAPLTPYIGYFNAGDTIDFYNSGAIATGNLYANAASNYFTIERIK